MIDRKISDSVLTIGPAPDMKGGIAMVLNSYYSTVFTSPKYLSETVEGGKLRKAAALAKTIYRLWRLSRTDKALKIAHIHTATGISFKRSAIFVRLAKKLGLKVVLHIHGAEFVAYHRDNSKFVERILRQCDVIVALSNSWRDFFCDNLSMPNVKIIHNITPVPTLLPPAEGKDGKVNALFLGLLGPRKGIFDLLDAISRNKGKLRGCFTLHVGGNGQVSEFLDKVKEHGLEDIVKFHGWITGDDKIKLLNMADMFVLPSYAEGLPISILEAMAYGLPVIATNVGGIPEVVGSENGALIEPGDVDALGKEIVDMVNDTDSRLRRGRASQSKIACFLPDNVAAELSELYSELI